MKKWLSIVLTLIMIISIIPFSSVSTEAAGLTLSQLKAKFPDGKYWNHYVNSTSEASDYLRLTSHNESFANTVTSSPCALHGSASLSYFVGKYDCNYFDGGVQCFGFARKLGYDAFGTRVSTWSTTTSISSVKAGDVIRYTGGGASGEHSVFVISASGTTVQVAECNWGKNCVISWGRSINLSNVNIVARYIAPSTLTDTQVTLTSDSKYSKFKGFKAYPCVSENFYCYNSDLTTSPGRIYTTDYCTINDVYTNGWCKVACPWSDGTTKTVYTKISNFIKTPSTSIGSFTSQAYINLYSTASMSTKIFRIYPNDVCYTIGTSGSATQVFMPHSDGYYVLGWIQTSEIPSSSSSYSIDSRYPTPFKCRVLSSSKVPAALTVGGARQSDMNVYVDDDCVITEVYTNGWCKFTCPWSDGSTKTLYLPLSEFINANIEPYTFTATQYTDTYYKSDKATKVGWIDVGDSVTVVSKSGSVSQAIYPADVGKRCGWANTSALTATYTVSYNANGGTGAPSSQSKTPGTALTLSTTKPTRTGYTFVGWATSSSATTASYTAGSTYTTDASVTLYAVWKQITYSIQYDANGGTNAPSAQTKTYGTNLTLSAIIPIREGYIFSGWNTDVNGSGTSYAASSSYNVNANVTLYAQWEAIVVNSIAVATMPTKLSYSIGENFDPTGLTLSVSMSDGSSCTITEGYECLYDAFTSSGTKAVTIRYINKEVLFSVEVVPETPDVTEFLTVTNKTVHAGEEFTVDVNIENNPGFCYLKLRLNYDSDSFEFIEAVNGAVSTDSFSSTTEALLWDSDKNATADGTLVTLKFKAKDNLAAGEYTLGIAFVEGYNYDEENITLGVNNATITVVEFIYGDVTGDNVINGKDLVRLRKYLLTLDETTGTADVEISLGADTTGDGVVNGKDLVRLRKYLLNYDEATGTSPIVLGPAS